MTTVTAALPEYLLRTDSPIGRIELTSDGDGITSLMIEKNGHLPLEHQSERPNPVLERAVAQLAEYFRGERTSFDVPVVLHGTPFQKAIWAQLADIPFGEVASYGELGMIATGKPAGRAVGGAVGANPVPLLVPCHRVLAYGGKITGYSAGEGIPTKKWLLDLEGIPHK